MSPKLPAWLKWPLSSRRDDRALSSAAHFANRCEIEKSGLIGPADIDAPDLLAGLRGDEASIYRDSRDHEGGDA